jgi:phospholipase C
MSAGMDSLKHIVVLMMENRSFDHMLGHAGSAAWPIDGLAGNETNKDSEGGVAQVSSDAGYAGDFTPDPGHSGFDTLTQLYGDPNTPVVQNPTMSGFVQSYEGKTGAGNPNAAHRIMKCFAPEKLPVLTRLAQQFCVCDRWFASIPGPTFPNRAFMHAATSIGRVDMGIDWRNLTTTIYERLAANKLDSVIYYHDSTMASTFNGLAGNPDFFGSFDDDFIAACNNNDLPPYSFIEPRFANSAGGNGQPAFSASDQHPDHDVEEGEFLIQTVFNAVWKNPKVRNSTLLAIVYDEHGGLYDHVPPPTTVCPDKHVWTNDGISTDPSFNFTRLGVRVPAVLISPYIQPGTIDHRVYDHTSIIATALKLLLPNVANVNLTLRDKNANTFEDNLTLAIPRTGNIDLGTGAKTQTPTAAQLAQPINDHLVAQVRQAAMMEKTLPAGQQSGTDLASIKNEAQAAAYLKTVYSKIHPKADAAKN